jgi:hypothetical protein
MSPWAVLGIEPTDDARAIRRAYAARLRLIDADREPAAFQQLRAAYEAALRGAAAGPPPTSDQARPAPAAAAGPAAPEEALDAELAAAVERCKAALNAGAVAPAAETLCRVREALPLALADHLTVALAVVAMTQPDLPVATLRLVLRAAAQDEHEPPAPGAGPHLAHVAARLRAERWYEALRAAARARPRSRPGLAAGLLTARPARRWGWSYGWLLDWRPLLAGLGVHGRWLPGRFDPRAVELARRLDARRPWVLGVALLGRILLGAGLLALWLSTALPPLAAILVVVAIVCLFRWWLQGIARDYAGLVAPLSAGRRALATAMALAAVTGGAGLVGVLGEGFTAATARLVCAGAVTAILSRWGLDWVVRLRAGRSPFAAERRRWWHLPAVLGTWLGLLALAVAVLTLRGSELLGPVVVGIVAWMAGRWLVKRRRTA